MLILLGPIKEKMNHNHRQYIIEKVSRQTRYSVGNIDVEIRIPFTSEINHKKVINNSLNKVPQHLLANIKNIVVGNFSFLKKRELDATFIEDTIFLSNDQISEKDLSSDIFHEIAHSVESLHRGKIYSDKKIEREFINKRLSLFQKLSRAGYKVEKKDFENIQYDKKFDMFLYKKITYSNLSQIASSLYIKPYSITSINEYFATAFEEFFMKKNVHKIKKISPALYEKLISLMDIQK